MDKSNDFCIDDMHEKYREIAEVIGVDTLLELADYFGGTFFYVPKRSSLFKNAAYEKIIEEFDGANIKQLAIKYELSERTIYRIVEGQVKRIRNAPLEGQLSLY